MKVAVIGTGIMGRNHIRIIKNFPEVKEVVICDVNENALRQTAKDFGIEKTYLDYKKILKKESPDCVIIATMTNTHKDIALEAMNSKVHVLVEKPIALNLKDAKIMIDTAKKNNVIFTVGHVERFNPVITKIKDFLDKKIIKNIYVINTHRVGPFPKRLLGKVENVLIDLSVHDFDIINYLAGKIKTIKSNIIKTSKQVIYAHVLMDLENGIKASSEFSWISPRYLRTIEIYGGSGMIFGDYYNQEVWFYENSDYIQSPISTSFLGRGLIAPGKVIKYPIHKQEPLLLELKNFVNTIRNKESLLVNPIDAYEALKVYLNIK